MGSPTFRKGNLIKLPALCALCLSRIVEAGCFHTRHLSQKASNYEHAKNVANSCY
jgi:hypothetical protein